jgi:predicted NUDIX family NTP pyrophosphohydrolase
MEMAARREFAEEVGEVPPGELRPLGQFRQSEGKLVTVFVLAGDFDPAKLVSNVFEIEWPPRSGRTISAPEVDRAAWFSVEKARSKLVAGQRPILEAFVERISAC